jgi:predicted NBD/HSP70 family sugar kinase
MTNDEKVLEEALKRFKKAEEAEQENRDLAEEDFRFAAGEQWPDQIRQEREQSDRPCLTFNRLPAFIAQVVGDARQNKPAIKVLPCDSGADVETAEVYNGLIRNIESQSRATQAYITAFEHSVTGGMGAFRILTKYASDDSFEQDIRIERITNPFSVYWDPNAREYDKSDAQWCFVSEWMTKEAFEAKYPKETPDDWNEDYRGSNWALEDRVRVAEYWCKKPVTRKIGLLDGRVIEIKKGMEGLPFEMTRTVESFKVVRYVLSGHTVLEGPSEWAGRWIPIVPVFGPEEWVDDRIRYRSLIRYAKDPQRQYNYWQSVITEKVALAPKSPWLVTPAMIAGLERFWNAANKENRAYLPYNPDPTAGRPERQQPAFVQAAELQQSAQAIDDMKATMGLYDASLGNQSNETSGKAIIARQREGDNATYAWIDNLARSIQHAGRILVDLIPRIYDTARIVRIMGEDEAAEMVPINYVLPTGEVINDLSVGKYDVEIVVGPSYATKRMEAAESMMAFVQAIPQSAQIAGDLIAKAMDWPGAETIAERLKKALPPGIVDEKMTPEEQQAQQAAMQEAEEMKQIQKASVIADIELKRAQAAKAKADASKVLVEAEAQDIENTAVETGMASLLDRMNAQDQAFAG